jgi:hypothetical protein
VYVLLIEGEGFAIVEKLLVFTELDFLPAVFQHLDGDQ